jgi:hypothetical protein
MGKGKVIEIVLLERSYSVSLIEDVKVTFNGYIKFVNSQK